MISAPKFTEEQLIEFGKIAADCDANIEVFARYFFPHLLKLPTARFHREIFSDLQSSNYYACAAPRGHAKSTLGLIIYSMYFSLFRSFGDITLLSASESFVINEIVRTIKREFETNERLKMFFGELTTKKWSETYFVIRKPEAL